MICIGCGWPVSRAWCNRLGAMKVDSAGGPFFLLPNRRQLQSLLPALDRIPLAGTTRRRYTPVKRSGHDGPGGLFTPARQSLPTAIGKLGGLLFSLARMACRDDSHCQSHFKPAFHRSLVGLFCWLAVEHRDRFSVDQLRHLFCISHSRPANNQRACYLSLWVRTLAGHLLIALDSNSVTAVTLQYGTVQNGYMLKVTISPPAPSFALARRADAQNLLANGMLDGGLFLAFSPVLCHNRCCPSGVPKTLRRRVFSLCRSTGMAQIIYVFLTAASIVFAMYIALAAIAIAWSAAESLLPHLGGKIVSKKQIEAHRS